MTAIIDAVRAHLCGYFEESAPGEAKLTFLGADPLTVLRFGPDRDGTVTYATLGCSRSPMQDPSAMVTDPDDGPRAELALPIIGGLDAVTRPLAMLAASPSIEGLVLQDGALLDFGQPLWPDARFTGFVLVDADVPDVTVGGNDGEADDARPATVSILQPVPATPNEFALARAKGVAELRTQWREKGTVLADPHRASVV
ncbi:MULTISPECIES: suppressor of fused domain protein [Corynebacterium]|uniref:suppressor of fused domain protein n=1 Tax=Corynebacterium TaxID=1716 RepID=UPI0008A4A2CF|nr:MULTISPECIES: suppressor of fused domain protein [Corynebacterium]MCG7440179.1 suppressor of fused domain protein [Corynebacterium freneyi]OFU52134.1 Suppressor of fused protein (SUFU) [Corynebacterium sp. HMSC11E11]UBI03052.1 suppressor of fused domain protein [Corynebacterium freneyi]